MNAVDSALPELLSLEVFQGYNKDIVFELCVGSQIQFCAHKQTIYQAGDDAHSFGIVLSGAFKLSKVSPMGDDVIVHFSTPGDVVAAFIMAMPKAKYPVTVRAMGPSRLLKIPKDNYLRTWKNYPELIFRIQNLLSSRMGHLQDQKAMNKAPLAAKVALLLMNLLDKQTSGNDHLIAIPLTRKEIADNLGASVESVIRIMSEWSKQGFIKTSDFQIEIISPDKIIDIMNSEGH